MASRIGLSLSALLVASATGTGVAPVDTRLKPCGEAYYLPTQYTCYDGDFLCPIENGEATLRCGPACYSPRLYSCDNGQLVQQSGHGGSGGSGSGSGSVSASASASATASALSTAAVCSQTPITQHLPDPPYDNYFYSDCHSANQVIVTRPLATSNLTFIVPRLLVAWPAGDSGVVAFFAPSNGINGTLGMELVNGTGDQPLQPVYVPPNSSSLTGNPKVGVTTLVNFNSSAVLTVPILGSIRTIRDFTEGPSLLHPQIQDAIVFSKTSDGGASLFRLWLDNVTTTEMTFVPVPGSNASATVNNRTVELSAGTYKFTATFDYPQLEQLTASEVLNQQSQDLIQKDAKQVTSLTFLSYTTKLLAGAWRFLTYFGRDSMISELLFAPVLSQGNGSATEAVIEAVLERLNRTDGAVCHEETIGDYATFVNLQNNVTTNVNAPGCTYIMVDSDYYLAPVVADYFIDTPTGRSRRQAFFSTKAQLDFGNKGMTYAELFLTNAERVMTSAAAFAQDGGQTQDNLIHLHPDQIVGEWRDSTYGIGGGRIPYDVNTALAPAALRAIERLAAAGFFPSHPEWNTTAGQYATVWEDETLKFFEVTVPVAEARALVTNYTSEVGMGFPSHADNITSDVVYHGLALDGNNGQSLVKVMNSDDCFRLYLLNTTNQLQLTSFVNQTANNILAPYPVGLTNPLGMLVANPAYGGAPVYAANWTTEAYHGTVIWGWPMAMMAVGLQRQLGRCSKASAPDFCSDNVVHSNVLTAYNHLWDIIEANSAYLSYELWSWQYQNGGFQFAQYGANAPGEADIIQLWSLTFIAINRDPNLK